MFLSWILIFFSLVITGLIFGLMALGVRNRRDVKEMGDSLDSKAASMDASARALLEELKDNKEQQSAILERLKNLETIVTSEMWDVIQKNEVPESVDHLLEINEDPTDITNEEKVKNIAKKVR